MLNHISQSLQRMYSTNRKTVRLPPVITKLQFETFSLSNVFGLSSTQLACNIGIQNVCSSNYT